MKILLTGSMGFLGRWLLNDLAPHFDITATGRQAKPAWMQQSYAELDLTNQDAVAQVLQQDYDWIIHNAAMSKPDICLNDPATAWTNNVTATNHLLQSAAKHTRFLYISTDFIFGDDGPHGEDTRPQPLNYYGETKLAAEQLVQASGLEHAIVRPVFIYGQQLPEQRGSFAQWVANSLKAKQSIKVVNDQLRTPTYAPDITKGIRQIIQQEARGAYHLAGKDIVSPYQMAVQIAAAAGLDAGLITAVDEASFPEPVRRAKKGGLLIDKAVRELGYAPVDIETGIRLSLA